MESIPPTNPEETSGVLTKWLKRFGFWGFMFFLVKGVVLYIILPAVLIWFGFVRE